MSAIYLENLAKLKVKQFARLFPQLSPNSSLTLKPMDLVGSDYVLKVEPKLRMDSEGKMWIDLKWKDKEKESSQTIEILKETRTMKSYKNSGVTYTYYYFKQNDKLKGRIIYYHEGKFQNRKEFKNLYKTNSCAYIKKRVARVKSGNPEKKFGKRFCKGKLTPYGVRCVKYEIAQLEVLKAMYGEITKVQEENLAELRKMLMDMNKKIKK